jgi:hypothetical protein
MRGHDHTLGPGIGRHDLNPRQLRQDDPRGADLAKGGLRLPLLPGCGRLGLARLAPGSGQGLTGQISGGTDAFGQRRSDVHEPTPETQPTHHPHDRFCA